jgi:EAL domain-containing protein (putative c-di-GMP-specific phosphodiesterase class I)/ActR/RegA family two-component response regulator
MNESFSGNGTNSGEVKLCYVVDDEPAICRFVAVALRNYGVETEQFQDVPSLLAGLVRRTPDLVLLDVSLGDSDAIEAIRVLSSAGMTGHIHLMSGADTALLENVRLIGERRGLNMGSVLSKPFRVDALKRIVDAERLQSSLGAPSSTAAETSAGGPGRPPTVDLGEALDRDWVELWYQPKLDLNDGAFVGAEGLARLRHPEWGLMFPTSFIANARSEDLVRLAEYALHTALRDMTKFAAAGHDVRLAINVPVEALVSLPIGAIVREWHRGRRSEWAGIILEVTEDEIIRDIQLAHEIATQLHIHGIDLALDDFGRGYSSLARLKELPFTELKLDRSFVDNCGSDPMNAALCKTAVELAHRFGSLAVAEGIEKERDLAVIQTLGCDIAQGFLFAHAMPQEVLLARLTGGGGTFGAMIAMSGAERRARA